MTGSPGPIGYYVHHHGGGHRAHAMAFAQAVDQQVVALSSASRPDGWPGTWITLERDDDAHAQPDPTRHGAWHWAPTAHVGFTARMRSIASWIADTDPTVFVSDVSVEAVVLAALLGTRTAAVMLHGQRDDPTHCLAWDTADVVIGPWPLSHAEPWQDRWRHKIRPVGLLSRYDHRQPWPTRTPTSTAPGRHRRALVIVPDGDSRFDDRHLGALVRSCPGWQWDLAGAGPRPSIADGCDRARWHGYVDDLWSLLGASEVVVSAAGAAIVADLAAARRPAVLVPQDRPFDEQRVAARHLDAWAPVVVLDQADPSPERWSDALETAVTLDGTDWARHHDRRGAQRFAEAVAPQST